MNDSLKKRLPSAIVMILMIAAVLWLGGWVLRVTLALVTVLMTFDVTHVLKQGGHPTYRIVLLAAAALLLPALVLLGYMGIGAVFLVAFCTIMVMSVFAREPDFSKAIYSCFVLVYPLLPMTVVLLISVSSRTDYSAFGSLMFGYAAVNASIADTGAYCFGNWWGKKKLCPRISPHKTIAGSIGAFVFAILGGFLIWLYAVQVLGFTGIGVEHYLILGFLVGGMSQIGDLTASMLKRYCNAKDYGIYIPGHGGIMDRMDSVLMCAVTVYLYFFFIGALA